MPPGHEPFLRAICADPEDDLARLVYADWLDENGEPERAELIRLQIERARLRAGGTDSEELARRDIELRHARGDEWRRELPRLSGVNWHRFWRGFVSGADVIEWRYYRDAEDALFAAAPVQFLHLSGLYAGGAAEEFTRSPYLTRLRGLTLSRSYLGGDGGQAFWATPAFAGLEWIELRNDFPLADWQLRAIIDSRALRRLKELRIAGAVDRSAVRPLQKRFGDRVRWAQVRG
jgi:uncharacterized protein (TIGR02996 family)